MDFAIDIATDGSAIGEMTFDQVTNIMNNVYLSLMVRRGAFFQNPTFGSRLHELAREKNTEHTASMVREYCKEALQWLIDCGRATKVDVYTERDPSEDLHRIKFLVEVTQADGRKVSFEQFVEVI